MTSFVEHKSKSENWLCFVLFCFVLFCFKFILHCMFILSSLFVFFFMFSIEIIWSNFLEFKFRVKSVQRAKQEQASAQAQAAARASVTADQTFNVFGDTGCKGVKLAAPVKSNVEMNLCTSTFDDKTKMAGRVKSVSSRFISFFVHFIVDWCDICWFV
jgi:hypothetical protein